MAIPIVKKFRFVSFGINVASMGSVMPGFEIIFYGYDFFVSRKT